MPEYVYALHEFAPEHDDEISFKAGERIEVIEKDDLYGDGWWQGRNLAGKVGLFPQSYTSGDAPLPEVRTPTTLQPLKEESGDASPAMALNETVMAATLTDVQEAIEQLAVRREQDGNTARSFSFASTRDAETETEDEAADDHDGDKQGWHKDARKALAERAEQENVRKQREEEEANGYSSPRRQSQIVPPFAVELSDESDADDEDEDVIRNRSHDIHPHHHQYNASLSSTIAAGIPHEEPHVTKPEPKSEPELEPEPLKPAISLSNRVSASSLPPQEITVIDPPAMVHPKPQTPTTATAARFPSFADRVASLTPSSTPGPQAANVPLPKSPSPLLANGFTKSPAPQPLVQTLQQSNPVTPPQPASEPEKPETPPESIQDSLKRTHPSEWTVEQVVEWLKTKNIDEATCSKFIEHEITGDVLLELDVNILKEELNITAFGKRMRINNAIVELRRPASFSSDPTAFHHGSFPSSATGTNSGTVDALSSPYGNGYRPEGSSVTSGEETASKSRPAAGTVGLAPGSQKNRPAQLALSSPSDGALNMKAFGGPEDQIPEEVEEPVDERGVQSETENIRASQGLSPNSAGSGTLSKQRRRFLGLSTESGSSRGDRDRDSSSRKSNDMTSPLSSIPNSPNLRMIDGKEKGNEKPSTEDGGKGQHVKGKRSIDGGSKSSERLSFFSSTLGKSRKPPPRYSMYDADVSPAQTPPEKSTRSITRLYLGHSHKKNGRPATSDGTSKDDKRDFAGNYKDSSVLRKRHISTTSPITSPMPINTPTPSSDRTPQSNAMVKLHPGESVLDQIGRPDYAGWLRKKGERYNTWKLRYLVLKGPHLYYLRSSSRTETKIKGYIKVQGYKVIADENANPGKYGFRIVHDNEPSHFFSSEEQMVVREWMKALMKATIDRDYSKPVVSSCNIPTIPLSVAQAMNPAPRPPSPTAREATQKALRRENPNQLSSRDARVLMGLPSAENGAPPLNGDRTRIDSFFMYNVDGPPAKADDSTSTVAAPPRPSRDMRNIGSIDRVDSASEAELVDWANSHLPDMYRIHNVGTDLTSGLVLLRLAESIKGSPSEPPVADSAFKGEHNLEGMFKLFDFLLDHDVKMGSVSINDVKQGRPDKTMQLLKALRAWEQKRKSIVRSIGKGAGQAGPWMAMETGTINW